MTAFYKDTTVNGKSVHKYSIKTSTKFIDDAMIGSKDLDELIKFVLDRGIDPNTELYVYGEKTEEQLIDLIQA